jgi:glycerophosphoryl diester phosphodiesterase
MKFILAITAVAILAAFTSSAASAASYTNNPRVVAHRTGGAPENTVAGARIGMKHSSFLETDVQFSSDNVPVLHHDSTLDRMTNGTGPISSKTWAQITTYRMANGQRPNSLGDILRHVVAPNPGLTLMIEVKDTTPSAAQVARLWRDINVFGAGKRIVIASFSLDAIKRMKASNPPAGIRWALNDSGALVAPATVDAVCGFYVAKFTDITAAQVAAYRNAGLYVIVYTANAETAMQRAIDLRANAVLTDHPGQLATTISSRSL